MLHIRTPAGDRAGSVATNGGARVLEDVSLEWTRVADHLLRIGLALALALPLGWKRERGAVSVVLRTFPIVALQVAGTL